MLYCVRVTATLLTMKQLADGLNAYFLVKIWSKLAPSAKCALSAVAQPPKALSIVNKLSLGNCLAYLACALAEVGR